MYPDGINGLIWVLNLVGLVWTGALTFLFLKERTFLRKLFPDRKGDFKERLEDVLKEAESLRGFRKKFLESIQKVGLKRYNPYRDTGGDQSFSVALLNGNGDGIVLTSLHSRAGTRVFAKPIKEGKEESFALSSEEIEVVAQAFN